jgi:hypothetical protein
MSGWIKLHRKLQNHWIAKDPELLAVWIHMLLDANHSKKVTEFNGSMIAVDRGQFVFGRKAYSQKTGVSESKIRRLLDRQLTDQQIAIQTTSRYSVITLLSYDSYQLNDQQTTSKPTTSKEVKNINNYIYRGLDYSNWPEMPTQTVLDDWLAMRAKQRADVSQTVINRFSAELAKAHSAGWRVDDCLAECVTRGWRGFKYEWVKEKANDNAQSGRSYQTKSQRADEALYEKYPHLRPQ